MSAGIKATLAISVPVAAIGCWVWAIFTFGILAYVALVGPLAIIAGGWLLKTLWVDLRNYFRNRGGDA